MIGRLIITIACAGLVCTKPIMVSFGTNGGPIVPPTPSTTTLNPLAPKHPAPVHEDQSDDVPPPAYRAPTPNQYRNLINSHKPHPGLQLGTPLDVKYQDLNTLSQLHAQQQKADYARQQGLGYQGAQVFIVQEYELDDARNRQQQAQHEQQLQHPAPVQTPTSAQQFVQQYLPRRQTPTAPSPPTTPAQQQQPEQQPEQKQNVRQPRHQERDQAVRQAPAANGRYTNTPIYVTREVQSQSQPQPQLYQPQRYNYQYNYNYNPDQSRPHHTRQQERHIPGFGVAFSSGLRYYVPQFYYYDGKQQPQQQDSHNPHSQRAYNEVRDNAIN